MQIPFYQCVCDFIAMISLATIGVCVFVRLLRQAHFLFFGQMGKNHEKVEDFTFILQYIKLTNCFLCSIIGLPNQLNNEARAISVSLEQPCFCAIFLEFDKMQIPSEKCAELHNRFLLFSWFGDYRGLRFCASASVGALFIFLGDGQK